MRRLIWLVGCAVPVWLGAQTAPDTPLITLRIVDPEGRPVPHARVMATMNLRGENYQERVTDPAWQRVSPRGLCVIDGDVSSRLYAKAALQGKQAVRFSAWIHAAGYRPVHVHHEGVLPREATVTLQPARSLEVRLYDAQGNPVNLTPRKRYYTPRYEESPIFVVEEQKVSLHDERTLLGESSEARDSWRRTPLYLGFGIEKIEPGRYRVELPTQIDGKLYLAIHQRGLIRGYLRPLSQEELQAGVVEVRLPAPGKLRLKLDFQSPEVRQAQRASLLFTPPNMPESTPFGSALFALRCLEEDGNPQLSPAAPVYVASDLAPGTWQVEARYTRGEWEDIDQAEAILTVASGRTTPCVLAPAPFDPKQYRGKRTVVLKIQRAGGKPAANAPYRVELYLWQRRKRLTVAQGKLDQSGMARLSQLYELPRGEEGSVNYQVYLNNQRIGSFELVEGDDKRQITFILPPRVGEPAPNFSLIDLRTNQTVTLQSLRGKWVYLEFWATWCGPCQSAMAALKAAVDQHGSRWRGKLEIITASVDGERSVVMPHLKQRGWEQFARHCWDAGQVASNAYGVEGIPTAFLIDPQGKVVWSGHPGEEEPGAKINRYLQQGGKR